MTKKLTLADISDSRAYERERDDFRTHVIALKKRRRIHVGPVVTFLFENRDTIRFQIQEMARVESHVTDESITEELNIYNPLVPGDGQLSATMFIELTSEAEQLEWKPKLIGILGAVGLRIGAGSDAVVVPARIEDAHAAQLTREIPPSVNFLHFQFDPSDITRFADEPVALVIDHENYRFETQLSADNKSELLADLQS